MSNYEENPLYQAFINKDYNKIKALLASENAKELVHKFGPYKTALHYAAKRGYADIIAKIIELGIDPNVEDYYDNLAPIHKAARYGHKDVCLELLKQGSDIEAYTSGDHFTPLYEAIENGHEDLVIELLKQGANIEALNNRSETPLLKAIHTNYSSIIGTLLRNNANIDAVDKYNLNALTISIFYMYNHSLIELLNNGIKIDPLCIYHAPNIETRSQLKVALLIDDIYNNKNVIDTNQYSDNLITTIIPRLEYLIKKNRVYDHLLNLNNIPEFIRPHIISIINKLKATDQTIQDAIELHLAIILNKIYPEQFPSILPYSQAKTYREYAANSLVCNRLLNSYEESSHFKPLEFFNYLLNPNNQNAVLELLIPAYNEAKLMLEVIDKLVLPANKISLIDRLKTAFYLPTNKEKHFNHVSELLDKAVISINAQAQNIEQLEHTIKDQQQTILSLQETVLSLQAESPKFQGKFAAERIAAKQPRIDSYFSKKTPIAANKRKAASYVESEIEHKSIRINQEKGI